MEKVHIVVDLNFEYGKCYVRLEYQKQPHNSPEGEEDEGIPRRFGTVFRRHLLYHGSAGR